MFYKKIAHISLLTLILSNQNLLPADSQSAVKEAIKEASRRAFWGWAKSRAVPAAAGAVLFAAPVIATAIGFMGAISHNANPNVPAAFAWLMVGGVVGSKVLIPVGSILMARQSFLAARDYRLYNQLTNSTAHLNTAHLPPAKTIRNMKTHHELFKMGAEYLKKEGNPIETIPFSIPGFKGFK